MPLKEVDSNRQQVFPGVTAGELERVADNFAVKTLQFAEPLTLAEIKLLESIVFATRGDITLRVYGHYGQVCNLSFLQHIPSVTRISLDCLHNAVGVEILTAFPHLETLALGIYNLENFDFIKELSADIKELSLGQTSSKKPSIDAITRFTELRHLYLDGQQKGIEAIGELVHLEKLVLRSVTTRDVNYLQGLKKLWSLDIKLGGIKNFEALCSLSNLKYLELWQIRGLSDIGFISRIESLQNIFLQSLKQVTILPSLKELKKLKRIYIENMKSLKDLSALEFAVALEEFIFVLAQNQQPEDILPVLNNPGLKDVLCRFGSSRKNDLFDKMADEHNKKQYTFSEFSYQ